MKRPPHGHGPGDGPRHPRRRGQHRRRQRHMEELARWKKMRRHKAKLFGPPQQRGKMFSYQERLKREQVAEMLEEIAAGIKAGTITLESGEEQVTLVPAQRVHLQVRSRQVPRRESLVLRMSWKRKPNADGPGLTISSSPRTPERDESVALDEPESADE